MAHSHARSLARVPRCAHPPVPLLTRFLRSCVAVPTFVRYSKAGARAGELRGADPAGLRRLVADANAGRV